MMKARLLHLGLLVLALALAVQRAAAQDGLQGALSRVGIPTPLARSLAIADFDGDQQPDGAVLFESGWRHDQTRIRIELHLSGGANTELMLESPERGLSVAARDMNNDGFPDVVVEQAVSGKRVGVWLNDGHGRFGNRVPAEFPSPATSPCRRLLAPMQPADPAALSLPQRYPTGLLLAVSISTRPPSARSLDPSSTAGPPRARAITQRLSRAPPVV